MKDTPTGKLLGYARVSTADQVLNLQLDALAKAGVHPDDIHKDKASGGSTAKRPGLEALLKDARDGDTVMVWRLDRLGRNLIDLVVTVQRLEERGVHFASITENIDTRSATGKMVFHLFAMLAQFERDLIKERTLAGQASGRARGRYPGRRQKVSDAKIRAARVAFRKGAVVAALAKGLGISKAGLYSRWRQLQEQEDAEKAIAIAEATKPRRKK